MCHVGHISVRVLRCQQKMHIALKFFAFFATMVWISRVLRGIFGLKRLNYIIKGGRVRGYLLNPDDPRPTTLTCGLAEGTPCLSLSGRRFSLPSWIGDKQTSPSRKSSPNTNPALSVTGRAGLSSITVKDRTHEPSPSPSVNFRFPPHQDPIYAVSTGHHWSE